MVNAKVYSGAHTNNTSERYPFWPSVDMLSLVRKRWFELKLIGSYHTLLIRWTKWAFVNTHSKFHHHCDKDWALCHSYNYLQLGIRRRSAGLTWAICLHITKSSSHTAAAAFRTRSRGVSAIMFSLSASTYTLAPRVYFTSVHSHDARGVG